jgi:hypothetical protein
MYGLETVPVDQVYPAVWRFPVLLERECREIAEMLPPSLDPPGWIPTEQMNGDMLVYAEVMPLGVGPVAARLVGAADSRVTMRRCGYRWSATAGEPVPRRGFGAAVVLAHPGVAAPVSRFRTESGDLVEVDHPLGHAVVYDRPVRWLGCAGSVELVAEFEAVEGGRA